MLGVWEFRSKSREERDRSVVKGGCRGYMFAMEVTQELETWPEQQSHGRKWVEEDDDMGGAVACTASSVSEGNESECEMINKASNWCLNSQEQHGIGSSSTRTGALFGMRTPAPFHQQEVRVMALAYIY
ncbi:hypothetical protein RJ641_022498 [Dillenia turbinata]|uniref:Uncharacterized protein n=1 Tax=Dillenia turbinata TaxID=194707 RepID=A0AAN8UMN9_9MAGN